MSKKTLKGEKYIDLSLPDFTHTTTCPNCIADMDKLMMFDTYEAMQCQVCKTNYYPEHWKNEQEQLKKTLYHGT